MTEDNGAKTEGAEVPKQTPLEKEAEVYADSIDRRGCAFWQGLYMGYIAGAKSSKELAAAKESLKELLPYVYSVLEREKDMSNTFLKGTYAEQIQAKMDRAKKLLSS